MDPLRTVPPLLESRHHRRLQRSKKVVHHSLPVEERIPINYENGYDRGGTGSLIALHP